MQRIGDQLLAGAVLALDQDVRLRVGDGGDEIEQLAHPAAAPDDVFELVAIAELALESEVFGFEIGPLDGAAQHRDDAVGVDGLLEEVRGARLDGLDRPRDAALSADDQDFSARLQALQSTDELGAADVGQHEIDQRRIRQPRREQLFGFRAARRDACLIAGASDDGGQPVGHIRLVVHDEHAPRPVDAHEPWVSSS